VAVAGGLWSPVLWISGSPKAGDILLLGERAVLPRATKPRIGEQGGVSLQLGISSSSSLRVGPEQSHKATLLVRENKQNEQMCE